MVQTELQPLSSPSATCWPLYTARLCAITCSPEATTWERFGQAPRLCTPFCLRYFDECLATGADGSGSGFANASMYCRIYGGNEQCLDIPANPPSFPPQPPPSPHSPPHPPATPPLPPPPTTLEIPTWALMAAGVGGLLFVLAILLRLRYAWEAAEQAKEARMQAAADDAHPGMELAEGARCYTERSCGGFDGLEPAGGAHAPPLSHRSCSGGSTARTESSHVSARGSGQYVISSNGASTARMASARGMGGMGGMGGAATHRGMATDRGGCNGCNSHRVLEPGFVTAARAATAPEHRMMPTSMPCPAPGYGAPQACDYGAGVYGAGPYGAQGGGCGYGGCATQRGVGVVGGCATQRGPYGEILPVPVQPCAGCAYGYGGAGGMCAPPQCMGSYGGGAMAGMALPGCSVPYNECAMPYGGVPPGCLVPPGCAMPHGGGIAMGMPQGFAGTIPPSPVGMAGMSTNRGGMGFDGGGMGYDGGGMGYDGGGMASPQTANAAAANSHRAAAHAAAADAAVKAAEAAAAAVAAATPTHCWPSPGTANTPYAESSCVSSDTFSEISETPRKGGYGAQASPAGMGGMGQGVDEAESDGDEDAWPDLPPSGASKGPSKETHQCV